MNEHEALNGLREILTPGTVVYTILRHTSASGMTRHVSPVVVDEDGTIRDLTFLVVRAGLGKRGGKHEGLKVTGTGMDMGFHVVYGLGRALYPEGVGDTENGGYLLKHRWL